MSSTTSDAVINKLKDILAPWEDVEGFYWKYSTM